MADKKATAAALDFTNVKDGGSFNKKHQAPGDYKGKVTKVVDAKSKKDGGKMWLYTIQVGTGTYPLYCKLEENQLWKIRNLYIAAGKNIPKKRVNLDPNLVVGRDIGVTLEDEEYEGKMQSNVSTTFPTSELEGDGGVDEDEDDEEETVDEPPAAEPKAKKKKSKEAPQGDPVEAPQGGKKKKDKGAKKVDDVDDSELEELEIEDI